MRFRMQVEDEPEATGPTNDGQSINSHDNNINEATDAPIENGDESNEDAGALTTTSDGNNAIRRNGDNDENSEEANSVEEEENSIIEPLELPPQPSIVEQADAPLPDVAAQVGENNLSADTNSMEVDEYVSAELGSDSPSGSLSGPRSRRRRRR
ncbi:hypothetical protein GGI12_002580 [Dipsacomyces acuminosporus]|nr:hypothetical protein GGI12_002580 [Dipsacomyces acuminosporus]